MLLRSLVGCLLLVACVLKGYEFTTTPVLETSVWPSRWIRIGEAEFEFLLGLWLLVGAYAKQSRVVAFGTFTVFSGVALTKAASGETSCSCFGTVRLEPSYVLLFDLAVLVALWHWHPRQDPSSEMKYHHKPVGVTGAIGLLLGLAGLIFIGDFSPAKITPEGEILGNNRVVVLEPGSWIGHRFPLLGHTEIGDRVSIGRWIVWLLRDDCAHCNAVLESLQAPAGAGAPGARTALIWVPPLHNPSVPKSNLADSPHVWGRLPDAYGWFVTTPVCIRLEDGIVTSAEVPLGL